MHNSTAVASPTGPPRRKSSPCVRPTELCQRGGMLFKVGLTRVDRDRDVRDRERVDHGSAISLLRSPPSHSAIPIYLDLEFASPTFRGPSRRLLLRHSFPQSLKKCLPLFPLPSCGEFRPLRLMDVMSDVLTLPSLLFLLLPQLTRLSSLPSLSPFHSFQRPFPPPSVVRLPLPYIFITPAPPAARRWWLRRSCKFDRQGVMWTFLRPRFITASTKGQP